MGVQSRMIEATVLPIVLLLPFACLMEASLIKGGHKKNSLYRAPRGYTPILTLNILLLFNQIKLINNIPIKENIKLFDIFIETHPNRKISCTGPVGPLLCKSNLHLNKHWFISHVHGCQERRALPSSNGLRGSVNTNRSLMEYKDKRLQTDKEEKHKGWNLEVKISD